MCIYIYYIYIYDYSHHSPKFSEILRTPGPSSRAADVDEGQGGGAIAAMAAAVMSGQKYQESHLKSGKNMSCIFGYFVCFLSFRFKYC